MFRVRPAIPALTLLVAMFVTVLPGHAASGQSRAAAIPWSLPPARPTSAPGDWPMQRGDAGNTDANLAETTITTQTAHSLTSGWTYTTSLPLPVLVVAGGIVYVTCGHVTGPFGICALDARTGRQMWFGQTPAQLQTPLRVAISGNIVVAETPRGLVGLNATTGAVMWTYAYTTKTLLSQVIADPVVDGGLLFFGLGWASPRLVYTTYAAALNVTSGKLVWSYTHTGMGTGGVSISHGLAILTVGDQNQVRHVIALNETTGKLAWSDAARPTTALNADPVADNGHVFSAILGSPFFALDVTTGRRQWTTPGPDLVAAAGYGLVIGGGAADPTDEVQAMDEQTGAIRWTSHTLAGVDQMLLAGGVFWTVAPQPQQNDVLFLGADAATGQILFTRKLATTTPSGLLALAHGQLYLANEVGLEAGVVQMWHVGG